jgi:hypothetical protein
MSDELGGAKHSIAPWQPFLEQETDLGYFIRGHLAIHNHLSTLLSVQLNPGSDELGLLDHATFNLIQTFEICVAVGAIPSVVRPLVRQINKVRNRLAHQITLDLDQTTAESVFNEMPTELRASFDVSAATPKDYVAYAFRFLLWLVDKEIAVIIARRERTRRKLEEDRDPASEAAFNEYWKAETDPNNPELVSLESEVRRYMNSMPFPLPRRLGFPDQAGDDSA